MTAAQELLNFGALATLQNLQLATPAKVAESAGHTELASLLQGLLPKPSSSPRPSAIIPAVSREKERSPSNSERVSSPNATAAVGVPAVVPAAAERKDVPLEKGRGEVAEASGGEEKSPPDEDRERATASWKVAVRSQTRRMSLVLANKPTAGASSFVAAAGATVTANNSAPPPLAPTPLPPTIGASAPRNSRDRPAAIPTSPPLAPHAASSPPTTTTTVGLGAESTASSPTTSTSSLNGLTLSPSSPPPVLSPMAASTASVASGVSAAAAVATPPGSTLSSSHVGSRSGTRATRKLPMGSPPSVGGAAGGSLGALSPASVAVAGTSGTGSNSTAAAGGGGGGGAGWVLSDEEEDVALQSEDPEVGRLFVETRDAFLAYLQSGTFSDLILICSGREYRVHRLILAYSSEYFTALLPSLSSSPIERVALGFEDDYNVLPDALRFMYAGAVDIKEESSIPLLAVADYYLMPTLKRRVSEYLSTNITRENAIEMIRRALKFQAKEMVEKCIHVIARNYCHIYDADYRFLPPHIFLKILSHRYLAVKSEFTLYKQIDAYVAAHRDQLSNSDIEHFMDTVRFRWMNHAELSEVARNALVPRALLVEAMLSKIECIEHPERLELEQAQPRLRKRIPQGIQFEYKSDFDDQGIVYWIATNGRRSNWENPHLNGRVVVSSSSIEKGNLHDLVSRYPTELWTKDVPSSWFSVDLGPTRAVVPLCYTLRHGANYKADSLRTWDLRGSNDGIKWILLKRHVNDESLNGNFASYSVSVSNVSQAFRHFRLLQTGRNSSNHNFLVLSGFELYGTLYEH